MHFFFLLAGGGNNGAGGRAYWVWRSLEGWVFMCWLLKYDKGDCTDVDGWKTRDRT